MNNKSALRALFDLITTLRGENGCPWDRKQTPASIAVYLIEETYELVEAIHTGDTDAVLEELGDVLFQILFLVTLYQKYFDFSEVVQRNLAKMVRRHPHVFGGAEVKDEREIRQRWREIKQQEKANAAIGSVLDSVPAGMPGLMRAYRIAERAAGTGFDWDNLWGAIRQVEAEWEEFKGELKMDEPAVGIRKKRATMEFGDVLFTMVNVARMAGIHPETALVRSTRKFILRFQLMEAAAAANDKRVEDLARDEMEALWIEAKKRVP